MNGLKKLDKKVALCGRAGAGKSSIAETLVKEYNYQKFSFADEVRKIAEELGHDTSKPYSDKVRDVLVAIGTTGRKVEKSFWVDKLIKNIKNSSFVKEAREGDDRGIVIDDARFLNEVKILSKKGFSIIKVHADESVLKERLGDGYVTPDNAAEKEIEKIQPDLLIDGTKDLETLSRIVNTYLLADKYG